jgi:hypothetical protein
MKKNLKLVILFVGTLSIATLGAKAISSHNGRSAGMDQIQIDVSSQDTNGITARDFNPGFLRSLEAYIIQETAQKMRQANRLANPEESDHLASEAVYVEGGKKLAVIRLQARSWNSVAIVGFVNEKLTRVVCTLALGEPIPISDGLCGVKIKEVFDMSPEFP